MYKKKIISILIVFLMLIGVLNYSYGTEPNTNNVDTKFHKIEALSVPEKDINFKVENLTRGCEVYLLIPNELLNYNLEKFIENNIENNFLIPKQKAEVLKKLFDNKDYLGYFNFLAEEGFETEENVIELRHYCISINEQIEVIGYVEHNNTTYIKLKINLKDNFFKIIMKDYLVNYEGSKIIFLIDEYGVENYIYTSNYQFTTNAEKTSIEECNINYSLYSDEDYDSINKSILIAYVIIFVIIFLTILGIIIHEIKKHKLHKLEIEKRLFWKEKTPKVKKALEKLERKEERKNKKKGKSK